MRLQYGEIVDLTRSMKKDYSKHIVREHEETQHQLAETKENLAFAIESTASAIRQTGKLSEDWNKEQVEISENLVRKAIERGVYPFKDFNKICSANFVCDGCQNGCRCD